jgi:hypothetical protein
VNKGNNRTVSVLGAKACIILNAVRRKFGLTGDWRKLHSKKLRNVFTSAVIRLIKSREIRWSRQVARKWETRNTLVFVVKSRGKKQFALPRWKRNTKIDFRFTEREDWTEVALDRLNGRVLC